MKERKKRRLSEALESTSKRNKASIANKMNLSGSQKPTAMERPSLEVTGAVEIKWKLLRRFYEPMLLLSLLDPVRGEHVDRLTDPEHGALSLIELRRAFVDKLAYLCDFKKGGNTITAVALQSCPEGVVVHLATNNHMKRRVQYFVRETLNLLVAVNGENHQKIEAIIFKKALALSKERLRTYWRQADRMITKCSKHLQG